MLFRYKVSKSGARAIQAEIRRDGQTYRSGWYPLPPTGLGIDERRVAAEEAIKNARTVARVKAAQVYPGEE